MLHDRAVVLGAAEQAEERDQADHEGRDHGGAAQQVCPGRRTPVPEQQQDGGTRERQRDDQPQQGEHPARGGRVDHRDSSLPQGGHDGSRQRDSFSTSAGSRRRPRPSGGCGRWS